MEINTQIAALYETGANVETIAKAMETSTEFVHGVLFSTCPRYRSALMKPAGASDKPLADEMLDIIAGIARNGTLEGIKLAAAKYVRNDQLGRLDAEIGAAAAGNQLLKDLSSRFAAMQERREKFLANRPNVIDVSN